MALGIYSFIEAIVLCVNAVCILNEERFLAKIPGWGVQTHGFGEEPGLKVQIFNLIRSIKTVMKCVSEKEKLLISLRLYVEYTCVPREDLNI